jgi:hypothetical protein
MKFRLISLTVHFDAPEVFVGVCATEPAGGVPFKILTAGSPEKPPNHDFNRRRGLASDAAGGTRGGFSL